MKMPLASGALGNGAGPVVLPYPLLHDGHGKVKSSKTEVKTA